MTKSEAIEKSIEHWQRMIEWVNEQVPDEIAHPHIMMENIGEAWDGEHCALCDYNMDKEQELAQENDDYCPFCPLAKQYGQCGIRNEPNEWRNVCNADTWGHWLKHAGRLLEQLKGLKNEG